MERRHPDGKRRAGGVKSQPSFNTNLINYYLNASAFIAVKMTAFQYKEAHYGR
jgi:hypothetical protein